MVRASDAQSLSRITFVVELHLQDWMGSSAPPGADSYDAEWYGVAERPICLVEFGVASLLFLPSGQSGSATVISQLHERLVYSGCSLAESGPGGLFGAEPRAGPSHQAWRMHDSSQLAERCQGSCWKTKPALQFEEPTSYQLHGAHVPYLNPSGSIHCQRIPRFCG